MPIQEVAAGLLHLQLVMVPLVFPTDELVANHQAAHHIVLHAHWATIGLADNVGPWKHCSHELQVSVVLQHALCQYFDSISKSHGGSCSTDDALHVPGPQSAWQRLQGVTSENEAMAAQTMRRQAAWHRVLHARLAMDGISGGLGWPNLPTKIVVLQTASCNHNGSAEHALLGWFHDGVLYNVPVHLVDDIPAQHML